MCSSDLLPALPVKGLILFAARVIGGGKKQHGGSLWFGAHSTAGSWVTGYFSQSNCLTCCSSVDVALWCEVTLAVIGGRWRQCTRSTVLEGGFFRPW